MKLTKTIKSSFVFMFIAIVVCVASFGIFQCKVGYAEEAKNSTSPLIWKSKQSSGWFSAVSSPIVAENTVVITTGNKIKKLSLETGEEIMSGDMQAGTGFNLSKPTYADGKIFVNQTRGKLECFDFATLKSLWKYQDESQGQCNCPIVYNEGMVFTGFWKGETEKSNYVALNAESGEKDWTLSHDGGFYWSGAVVDGDNIFVGSDDGQPEGNYTKNAKIYCLNKQSGKVVCTANVLGDCRMQLKFQSGYVFATTKAGNLYALKLENEKLEIVNFAKLSGCESTSQVKILSNKLYVSSGDGMGQSGYIDVFNVKTFEKLNTIKTTFYPQCGVEYIAHDFGIDFYYNYNGYPGGINIVKFDENDKFEDKTYFEPSADAQNYCIGFIEIADNHLLYKNDSGYIFCLAIMSGKEIENQSFSIENLEVNSNFDAIKNNKYSIGKVKEIEKVVLNFKKYQNELSKANKEVFESLMLELFNYNIKLEFIENLNKNISKYSNIENVKIEDEKQLVNLQNEFKSLSAEEQSFVECYSDIENGLIKIKNEKMVIGFICGMIPVLIVMIFGLCVLIRKRNQAKIDKYMEESDE